MQIIILFEEKLPTLESLYLVEEKVNSVPLGLLPCFIHERIKKPVVVDFGTKERWVVH
ncbi:MAG: hypothetical protein OHK006_09370 [Thermodesulfovibrionales bacterium]